MIGPVRMVEAWVSAGTRHISDAEGVRRQRITNLFALVAASCGVAMLPVHVLAGAPARGLLLSVAVLAYISVPVIAALGSTALSRPTMLGAVILNIFLMQSTDASSHIWFGYVAVACASMVMYARREQAIGWTGSLLSIALASLTATGLFDPLDALIDQPPIPTWADTGIVVLSLSMVPAGIFLLNRQVAEQDARNADALDALAAEVAKGQRTAAALAEATARAEAASTAKSAFLANMSHEIRTPLAAVISLNGLARSAPTPETREEYLDLVGQSASHLLDILNDILDLSKVEAGRMELEATPTDVGALIEEVGRLTTVRAQELGLEIRVDQRMQHPWRSLDTVRLKQVLLNLIGNALKFTERGSVELRAWEDADDVIFEVQDTGIGMSEDQLARVLEPFDQAEVSTTRRFGGTGLGLTICRRLVDLWGGEMTLASVVGQGTTVTVRLPLPPCVPERPQVGPTLVPKRAASSLRILLVEDNLVNQLIARRVLEAEGHSVGVANHGGEAVECAFDGYEMVLMDLQMPVLDGREATRAIRAAELAQGRARLPIVALTANAMSGEEQACLDAGMDAYLTKPIDLEALRRVLGTVAREPQGDLGAVAGIRTAQS